MVRSDSVAAILNSRACFNRENKKTASRSEHGPQYYLPRLNYMDGRYGCAEEFHVRARAGKAEIVAAYSQASWAIGCSGAGSGHQQGLRRPAHVAGSCSWRYQQPYGRGIGESHPLSSHLGVQGADCSGTGRRSDRSGAWLFEMMAPLPSPAENAPSNSTRNPLLEVDNFKPRFLRIDPDESPSRSSSDAPPGFRVDHRQSGHFPGEAN